MIDTSVLVAGLVENHEFHREARSYAAEAATARLPGIVLAEAWSVLRRPPFSLDASAVSHLLSPWTAPERIVPTPPASYVAVLRTGAELYLGGNVHDLLIAHTCHANGLPLATLDRRQASLASTIQGLAVELILPGGRS